MATGTAPPRGSAAAAANMRRRRTSSGAGASGGAAGTMLQFYTDDAPGLKISPNVVLVMSIGFIAFVAILHVMGKLYFVRKEAPHGLQMLLQDKGLKGLPQIRENTSQHGHCNHILPLQIQQPRFAPNDIL
ncbi:hypothetical protein Goshw_025020 [Gossypium schwendimanii]|uniref:Protein transport protein Sec61 subunit beta n=1 Tax=Gossypium schwendimanii TaxID=34291 RepID=A0A7J9L5R7_GOSSC|nr:hypothetical protein [Gossypium schwendimanii]